MPNATEVVLDFLAILMAEIDARGGGYRVVGEAMNVDAEVPVRRRGAGPFDLRLTDRDVILARDTVQTSNFVAGPFAGKFEFVAGGTGGIPIALTRSTSRVDAVLGDAHFTFANAHLEIQAVQLVQIAQATEMMSGICVGAGVRCCCSATSTASPAMNSYPLLTTQFNDGWDDAGGGASGFTCCQAGNLMNPESIAANRIDLVSYRGRFRVNEMTVRGTDPGTGRTPGGLWASDHFGVFAHVELVP